MSLAASNSLKSKEANSIREGAVIGDFLRRPQRLSVQDEPTWEVAAFFPRQGRWTAAEYLSLHANRMVELNDGWLEILPMPTRLHQLIAQFLHALLVELARTHGGECYMAPIPVYLDRDRYREPDVVYCGPDRIPPLDGYPQGADLVIEVVSDDPESRERNYVEKRAQYAEAGISEYWIVDPVQNLVTVLTLDGSTDGTYRVHGEFRPGNTASSARWNEFQVDVQDLFSVGQ